MTTSPYGVTIGTKQNAPGSYLKAAALSDMAAMGYTELRFQVPSSVVLTAPGTYDWGIWDDAVAKCNGAGINLSLSIMQPTDRSPGGYAQIAAAVAARYNGKSGHGSIAAIELGNEDFDGGPGTVAAPLVAVLKAAYPMIKAQSPTLPVVMGSILQRNSAHIRLFMDGMWAGAAGFFDVANFHFYTCIPGNGMFDPSDGSVTNVPSLAQFIDILRASHAAAGHPNFPTWCTEFGFAVNPNWGRPAKCVTDEATQWKYLQYCYDQMRTSGFITKSHIFTLGYAQPLPDGMSLVQAGGHHTLAYTQMASYTKQHPSWDGTPIVPPVVPPPVPVPPPATAPTVVQLTNFTGTVTITPAT